MTMRLDQVIEKIRTSQKTLFILCGLPYSGKTYIAQHLVAATGIACVRIDDIFDARGYSWDENRLPDVATWDTIFSESYEAILKHLTRGENVLYDSTNHTRASRDKLRDVARDAGGTAVVIYIDVPTSTIWERWETAKREKTRSVVGRELVAQTIDAFEPPTSDESILNIT